MTKISDLECSYTNESKVIAANYTAKLETNEIFKKHIHSNYSQFSLQRFKW